MTIFELTHEIPLKPRTWADRPTALAGAMQGFRSRDVIAEIKPHTTDGIRAGIRQLQTRAAALRRAKKDPARYRYHLITYRQAGADTTRYETFISDPRTTDDLVLRGRGKVAFLRLSAEPIHFPDANQRMQVFQCPSILGNALEPLIRSRYAAWMRSTQGHAGFTLPAKSPHAGGADITHELVAFLRELAAELEAEAASESY